MRAKLLLLFVLIAACGRSKGEAVKLGDALPAVGDVESIHQDSLFQATISSPRGPAELIYRTLSDEKLEILEVAGAGSVTKQKVTYVAESHTMTLLGESEQQSPATTGHSYLVWREGGVLRASRADGSAPSDEELALVLADHRNLGVMDPIQRTVSGRAWRRGERVTFSADELGGGGSMRGVRFTSLVMTLRRVDQGVANFEMHLGLATRRADEDHSSTISGIMKVDVASGDLIEIAGGGPVQGRMAGMPFSGHATILMEVR